MAHMYVSHVQDEDPHVRKRAAAAVCVAMLYDMNVSSLRHECVVFITWFTCVTCFMCRTKTLT